MNDVKRAIVCVLGLFSFLERFPPTHSRRNALSACRICDRAYRSVCHVHLGLNIFQYSSHPPIHLFSRRLKRQTNRKDFMCHVINGKGPAATSKENASHFNVIVMAGPVTTRHNGYFPIRRNVLPGPQLPSPSKTARRNSEHFLKRRRHQ